MKTPETHVTRRQEPLRARYRTEPEEARIRDGARTHFGTGLDAFHGEVVPHNADGAAWSFGIHRAVGGDHDAPTPGDILSAALAACVHSVTRMIGERLGIEILALEVEVEAEVDVRGCLLVDASVPVGFQHMDVDVRLSVAEGVDPRMLRMLVETAEHCCVVLQTLEAGTDVRTRWDVEPAKLLEKDAS